MQTKKPQSGVNADRLKALLKNTKSSGILAFWIIWDVVTQSFLKLSEEEIDS